MQPALSDTSPKRTHCSPGWTPHMPLTDLVFVDGGLLTRWDTQARLQRCNRAAMLHWRLHAPVSEGLERAWAAPAC